MHRAIAEKLRRNPDLKQLARDNIARWRVGVDPRSMPYLDEWLRLLELPVEELAALMEEDSERMRALRQCSPFAGALEPKERWEIFQAYALSPVSFSAFEAAADLGAKLED